MGYGFAQTKNRLLEAANGMTKLEFGYDYLGRRLTKKVWQGETLTQSLKFVYDNYKLIAVLDALADDAVRMTFVWQPAGLDVPLMMTYDSERYFYVTDGNKNVIALYDTDGILMASYSYGPFGQLLTAEGPLAQINPFQFSSEYYDTETDLVYYNYRYYSPRLGRWLSRDPIGEDGGLNLYAMCNNNCIVDTDYTGLGVLKDTYDFMNDPKGFMLSKFTEYNPLTFAVVEAAEFSQEFYRLLIEKLNEHRLLKGIEVTDPKTKSKRSITFEDLRVIEDCVSDGFPGKTIETAGTDVLGGCFCFCGYTSKKSLPTQQLVKNLFNNIGTSFVEATWNRIVEHSFSIIKSEYVKAVRDRLPNVEDKHFNELIDDVYNIYLTKLVDTIMDSYKKYAKF